MPTPVSSARQCLTEEAARALDDAVAVARRRSHTQTTSLHAVSALLALPSSALRDACLRARRTAYSPRLQLRALELSVGVSLDRLPTSKAYDEPPVANSLMAAIKRSQANQRRHPDTFHLYQQLQNQTQSSISCVKVEMKHFILSILDDPIVSRVFGEAGFRSTDIKFAILQPPPNSRLPRSLCPPLFLCNLPDVDPSRRFNFPFAGFENVDENNRKIGEILVREKGEKRNPLLIGVCAKEALSNFTESLRRGKTGVFPAEIDGLSVISVENEISEFVSKGGKSKETMDLKFKDVRASVENCSGARIVVSIGELKVLSGDGGLNDDMRYVVSKLSGLVEVHGEKLWIIGAVDSYDTYMKVLAHFPSMEKDWDLQVLPITSSSPSSGGLPTKSSLMRSFVPLGGFFSSPSEFSSQIVYTNQSTRCGLCNDKYEQEVSLFLNGDPNDYSASSTTWLQIAEHDKSKAVDVVKAKDDGTILNTKMMAIQRKWNETCQRCHPRPFHPAISSTMSQLQHIGNSPFASSDNQSSCKDSSLNGSGYSNLNTSTPMDLERATVLKQSASLPVASEASNANFLPRLQIEPSKSNKSVIESLQTSPSSVTSVTTDLGLGTTFARKEPEKTKFEDSMNRRHCFSGTAELDRFTKKGSNSIASPSFFSSTESPGQIAVKDFKSLYKILTEKIGRQSEAISTISQAIAHYKTGLGRRRGLNQKGGIWLSFIGHDKVGKKRVAEALAEIILGRKGSLISVDLSSENGMICRDSIFGCRDLNSYDVKYRGKTGVDCVVDELSKNPNSVVLLENVDKADFLAQNSLSQAVRTGRFVNSHGREISINNAIFFTTSKTPKIKKECLCKEDYVQFPEERILEAKSWQMQILVRCIDDDATKKNGMNVSVVRKKETLKPRKRMLIDMNESIEQENTLDLPKRAHKGSNIVLDLNLPSEEVEEDIGYGTFESDTDSENTKAWSEDFFDQVDENVVFKPFDFDALTEEVLKEIDHKFKETVGSKVLLEIDEGVMVHVLAAAWLSDRKRAVFDWVEHVLGRSFAEAKQRYNLNARTIMKLVACEGVFMEEQALGVRLPSRIILN